jgi:hypothetical protein
MLRDFVGEEQEISEKDLTISNNSSMDNDKRPEIVFTKPNSIPESIRWATIDFDPRFTNNFDPSTFSESYRVEKWARDNIDKPFSLDMPFVRDGSCRKSRAELKTYLDEHKAKHHKRHVNMPLDIGPFNDWRDEVVRWWNSWCEPNAWYPKKEQMLIIGPDSNTGKTMFVTQAVFRGGDPINEIPREAILIPERSGNTRSVSTFAWQKAKPAYHSVIYCDEFEIGYYNTETLKIVLEGSFFNPQIKMKCSGDDIQLAIPAIFISNTEIPEYDRSGKDMKPLLKRFKIVRIPKTAKKYKSDDYNPYIELFEEKKLNDLLVEKLKEHEKRENEKLLANLIELESNIREAIDKQQKHEEETERFALDVVEQNEKASLDANELVSWLSEKTSVHQFQSTYAEVSQMINQNEPNDQPGLLDFDFMNSIFLPTTNLDQEQTFAIVSTDIPQLITNQIEPYNLFADQPDGNIFSFNESQSISIENASHEYNQTCSNQNTAVNTLDYPEAQSISIENASHEYNQTCSNQNTAVNTLYYPEAQSISIENASLDTNQTCSNQNTAVNTLDYPEAQSISIENASLDTNQTCSNQNTAVNTLDYPEAQSISIENASLDTNQTCSNQNTATNQPHPKTSDYTEPQSISFETNSLEGIEKTSCISQDENEDEILKCLMNEMIICIENQK